MSVPVSPPPEGAEGTQEDSAAGYMAMLRRIHEVSGRTAGQIAASSGLPRSTAYRFIDPKNNSLPKNREQLRAFLIACRLPDEHVTGMLRLWAEVSGHTIKEAREAIAASAASPSLDTQAKVVDPSDDPQLCNHHARRIAMWTQEVSRAIAREDPPLARTRAPQGAAVLDVDLELLIARRGRDTARRDSAVCSHPRCLQRRQGLETPAPEVRSRGRSSTVLHSGTARVVPMVLLFIAIYPMAMSVQFGRIFTNEFVGVATAVAIVSMLLFITSKWVHGPHWPRLLTPVRLAAATGVGVTAGVLAWLAVPSTLVGVLTGFTVFTVTPLWIDLTNLSGILTSTRGVFVSIATTWCGITLGYVASLIAFPVLGSVLVGVVGAAMTITLLSSKVLAEPESDPPHRIAP
ncbi:hypothetical protein ABTW96_09035 [Nocardia beijingensis]|uniref:hypothetical protein n=1 Tax=Nocardia beijingensis TaxID=95162 RepID=UPI003327CBA8